MAGPRKFSEKIALLNQKEAEGNAAFDSIMVQVKAIRPTGNSGSQLDMLDNLGENMLTPNHTIDETIAFNEHISVTYDHKLHQQQQALAPQFQQLSHNKKQKSNDEQQNKHQLLFKNEQMQQQQQTQQHHQIQHSMLGNNSYLQLPNQTDSFRRAHSDSSLHNTVTTISATNTLNDQNNYNLHPQQQQQQPQQHMHQQHHLQPQQTHHYNQQQFHNQHYQFQQQQQQQQMYQYTSQQQQQPQNTYQLQPSSYNNQNTPNTNNTSNEYNTIPYRNLSLPINSVLPNTNNTNVNNNNTTNTNGSTNSTNVSPTSPTTNNKLSINNTNNSNSNNNNNNNTTNNSNNNIPSPINLPSNKSSSTNNLPASPTNLSPTNLQLNQICDTNSSQQTSNGSSKNYLLPKFMHKNEQIQNLTSNTSNLNSPTSPNSPNNVTNNTKIISGAVTAPTTPTTPSRNSLSPVYNLPQTSQPTSPSSASSTNAHFTYQQQPPQHGQQNLTQLYQSTFQQPHQQYLQQHPQQTLQPGVNNNLLNASTHLTPGGSLPDLTSFQFQNNQAQQTLQLQEYNQRQQHQQQQSQLQHQQSQMQHQQLHHHYDMSSQLLQPNFQQHNHIGPVKPTHNNSVSPTRGLARYSPTRPSHSNSNLNNSLANRRPSPQRNSPLRAGLGGAQNVGLIDLGLNNTQQANLITSAQSTPNSPLNPPSIPSLEFTVNSQQVNSYLSGNLLNGLGGGALTNSTNPNANNHMNGNLYRTASAGNNIMNNGINGESLPPSPQSQQSCFNSPQGSPGPLSISPQDINPFTSNNYDIMQKKFDSINLDASFNAFNASFNGQNKNPAILANGKSLINLIDQKNQNCNINVNNVNLNGTNGNNTNGSINIGIDPNNSNNNTNNINTNSNNNVDLVDIGAGGHPILDSSRSGSLSSSGSSGNALSNGLFEDIELQNLNTTYQQQISAAQQTNQSQSHSNSLVPQSQQLNLNCNKNNNIVNKNHKNSIPNIILTYSGDSIEEKNDIIIKDLSNELIYADDILIKNEQFDLDLQMLSEPVAMDDQSGNNNLNNFNEQTLYQNS